jgi:hypothetical protein
MNKNVVIALVVSLAITTPIAVTANPTKVGNNEVSEVSTVTADVPVTVELPSLKYSQIVPLTLNVQKDTEASKEDEVLTQLSATEIPVKVENIPKEQKADDGFKHYDLPLSIDLQRLIWELCKKYDLDYELMFGIIQTESDFNPKAISYDNSSMGLMQVNVRNTFYPMAKELGIQNANVFNPEDNIRVGIYYISTLKDAWKDETSGQNLIDHIILSYRFGVAGSKSRSLNHPYVQKVKSFMANMKKGENRIYD